MRYRILKNGEIINTIIADEAFVADYCAASGYTYESEELPEPPPSSAHHGRARGGARKRKRHA